MNKNIAKLNFQEKLNILNKIEKGEKVENICDEYGINKSTVCRIIHKKGEISEFIKNNYLTPKKFQQNLM